MFRGSSAYRRWREEARDLDEARAPAPSDSHDTDVIQRTVQTRNRVDAGRKHRRLMEEAVMASLGVVRAASAGRRWFAVFVLAGLVVAVVPPALSAASDRGVSAPTQSEDAIAQLPLEAKAAISRVLGRDNPSFRATRSAAGYHVMNEQHGFSARFSRSGFLSGVRRWL